MYAFGPLICLYLCMFSLILSNKVSQIEPVTLRTAWWINGYCANEKYSKGIYLARKFYWKIYPLHVITVTYFNVEMAGHSLFISRFALRSFHFHGSLSLYRSFGQFSGSLIAQSLSEKPVVRSRKRAQKRKIAPKTTAVRSYVCIVWHWIRAV